MKVVKNLSNLTYIETYLTKVCLWATLSLDAGRSIAMTIERTTHPYIIRDTNIYNGEPIIEGTRIGVRHVILLFQSGKDPEEIASIHRLTLAQVYDAISYFYDNEGEIEHYIRHEAWGNG